MEAILKAEHEEALAIIMMEMRSWNLRIRVKFNWKINGGCSIQTSCFRWGSDVAANHMRNRCKKKRIFFLQKFSSLFFHSRDAQGIRFSSRCDTYSPNSPLILLILILFLRFRIRLRQSTVSEINFSAFTPRALKLCCFSPRFRYNLSPTPLSHSPVCLFKVETKKMLSVFWK